MGLLILLAIGICTVIGALLGATLIGLLVGLVLAFAFIMVVIWAASGPF